MSSVDLHTHASYQLMLPEAIAIVCAPRFNTCVPRQAARAFEVALPIRYDTMHTPLAGTRRSS
jgi:hypothetical protein